MSGHALQLLPVLEAGIIYADQPTLRWSLLMIGE